MRQNNYFTLDEEYIENNEISENAEKTNVEKAKNKRKIKKPNFLILASLSLVLIILSLFFIFNKKGSSFEEGKDDSGTKLPSISVEMPQFTEDVMTVSPAIGAYIKSEDVNSALNIYSLFVNKGFKKVYYELPVEISCRVKSLPSGIKLKSSLVTVSESENFEEAFEYKMDSNLKAKIYSLKTNTKYFYKINLQFTDGTTKKGTGTFKTADMPRVLSIDGLDNVRDIGGYKTIYGKRIKQGLLFRGTSMDGIINPDTVITEAGVETMLSTLKIKFDMDLRWPSDNPNNIEPLGDKITHKYYGCYAYSEIFKEEGKSAIKNIFSDLADKSNYPIYIHCNVGRDRTGTVCYLLGAILGMSKEDLTREFHLSSICYGWTMGEEFEEFEKQLNGYKGNNINEKVESYLISVGVKKSEIEKIREIFLG